MKNNIIRHLTIRIGIPLMILFLIWKIGDIKNGSLEESLFFSIFSSILMFVIIIFIIKETLAFHRDKKLTLRNINIFLLMFYIPIFLFMLIASFAIVSF